MWTCAAPSARTDGPRCTPGPNCRAASPPQGAWEGPLRDPHGVARRRGRSSKAGPLRAWIGYAFVGEEKEKKTCFKRQHLDRVRHLGRRRRRSWGSQLLDLAQHLRPSRRVRSRQLQIALEGRERAIRCSLAHLCEGQLEIEVRAPVGSDWQGLIARRGRRKVIRGGP